MYCHVHCAAVAYDMGAQLVEGSWGPRGGSSSVSEVLSGMTDPGGCLLAMGWAGALGYDTGAVFRSQSTLPRRGRCCFAHQRLHAHALAAQCALQSPLFLPASLLGAEFLKVMLEAVSDSTESLRARLHAATAAVAAAGRRDREQRRTTVGPGGPGGPGAGAAAGGAEDGEGIAAVL